MKREKNMVTVRWTDGVETTAPTAEDVIDMIRTETWPPAPETRLQMKDELAHRAHVWSSTTINRRANPTDFLLELERAGLLEVINDE